MGWAFGGWLFASCRDSTKRPVRTSRARRDRCPCGSRIGLLARAGLGAALARGLVTQKTAHRRSYLREAYRHPVGEIFTPPSVGSEFYQRGIGGAVSAAEGCAKT